MCVDPIAAVTLNGPGNLARALRRMADVDHSASLTASATRSTLRHSAAIYRLRALRAINALAVG